MAELLVTRWTRYGKDRLYVKAHDGTSVGWLGLLTGESHIEVAEFGDAFREATAGWALKRHELGAGSGDITSGSPQHRTPPAQPAVVVPTPAWTDFAANRAGAMAREQALALRRAAPVRTLLGRVLSVHNDERAWRIGADGEEKVAEQLAKLARKDPRWHFLHAVPVGDRGSDIDHMVVGPGGVFTLNAKHHPGGAIWVGGDAFMVNGTWQRYVRNSRFEAARASKLLTAACGFGVVAEGVVVVVGADKLTVKEPPPDVAVVSRMRLVNWFSSRQTMLDDATVRAIFDAARRSTTWQPTPDGARDA
jgi:hypothetical protein